MFWPAKSSIRRRLTVQLLVIAAVLSLVFVLIVRVIADQAATATQDNILLASATSISDTLYSERGAVTVEIPYSALSMLGTISQDRVFYRVSEGARTLTGYDDLPLPDVAPRAAQSRFDTFLYRGETVRSVAVSRTVSSGGSNIDVTVVVAQTRLGLALISSRISFFAAIFGVLFFLVATALSLLAAQSALSPLERLKQSLQRRGAHDLRPVQAELPSELTPLVDALNNFMGRLRASLTQSEDFIAEAAHRVRTPLAVVRAQAEIALRRVERPENKNSLREMIRAVDESSRSAGQLLDHAMVTFRTDALADDEFDLAVVTKSVCDHLLPTAELKDILLIQRFPDTPCPFRGDAILMQNALRNVLDNALKYSPADSTVRICLDSDDLGYRISFTDQGRGFGSSDVASLIQRFSRGSNVADIVGSGLGLTIADEVARAHNGRLEITSNPEEAGACVSLIFPQP
jgi:two-component system, OmpR family, sensor histidine kinase TctE